MRHHKHAVAFEHFSSMAGVIAWSVYIVSASQPGPAAIKRLFRRQVMVNPNVVLI